MSLQSIQLRDIAHARSGDKGSSATLGVIAYTQTGYHYLQEHLTASVLEEFFQPLGCGPVSRFELPNLGALSFLLPQVLGEGGSRSLRVDAQGKTLAQGALEIPLAMNVDLLPKCLRKNK